MSADDLFDPTVCEMDASTGEMISARNLGDYAEEGFLYPILDAFETADTPEQFHRAAAKLMLHARHLHPIIHARIARRLAEPFKRPTGRPRQWERHGEIVEALRSRAPGAFGLMFHEWSGLSRTELIEQVMQRYGMTEEAARKAYDAAKREVDAASEQDGGDGKNPPR